MRHKPTLPRGAVQSSPAVINASEMKKYICFQIFRIGILLLNIKRWSQHFMQNLIGFKYINLIMQIKAAASKSEHSLVLVYTLFGVSLV